MAREMKILGLILARGGSVRVPRKNIRPLAGHPLIYYVIQAARKSKYINRIIVSTDDEEIAKVARECGAEVPFYRPKEFAKEDSPEFYAIEHALNWLRDNEGYIPDLVVKLFPTSPFLKPSTIDKAIEMMLENPDADSLRSVRLCKEHPYKMWVIEGNRLKSFVPLDKKPKNGHSLPYQILPKVYIQNACIDVIRPKTIWEKKSVTGDEILALVMDEMESFDINTELDFIIAEELMKRGFL
ncbi:MAG: acylneuraminate cytidylyltransferase family protein [Candidatus Hadarchaeales archaeon]